MVHICFSFVWNCSYLPLNFSANRMFFKMKTQSLIAPFRIYIELYIFKKSVQHKVQHPGSWNQGESFHLKFWIRIVQYCLDSVKASESPWRGAGSVGWVYRLGGVTMCSWPCRKAMWMPQWEFRAFFFKVPCSFHADVPHFLAICNFKNVLCFVCVSRVYC